MIKITVERHRWELMLAAGMLATLALLAWRNHGLMPYIFTDELSYSMFSRLLPLREASVPSYLYLWMFAATSACGTGFLECVRYGNEVLFVAAAPFLYLTACRVCSKSTALVLALVALAGPVNTYTSYFMPESAYFFGFSVLAWISLVPAPRWQHLGLAGGMVIGVLSLVKVHALFLLPAQLVFVFAACYLQGDQWLRRGAGAAALTLLVMLAVRYALGYALAGNAGLQLLGSLYSSQAATKTGRWASFIPTALANLKGHLMALALLGAFPLALLCQAALSPAVRRAQPRNVASLQVYTFLMLGASLGMTVLYTASLFGEGDRLHMRYYNFTFPLLFMVSAAAMRQEGTVRTRALPLLLAAAGVAALAWSARHLGMEFRVLWGDGAEAAAMAATPCTLYTLAGAGIAVLALWTARPRLAAGLFMFGFLPLFALLTGLQTAIFQRQLGTPSAYDSAGMFARGYLPASEREQLAITGGPAAHLMRTKFHVDAANASLLHMDQGALLDTTLVPADRRWLLVVGQHALPDGLVALVSTPEFALVRLPDPSHELYRVNLGSEQPAMDMVSATDGMSHAEPWGRWSDGPALTLRFKQALPKKLVLVLVARAYGPNIGKPFVIRVGNQAQQFIAAQVEREFTLRFDTNGTETSFTIVVPQPSSPTAPNGEILDPRKLGVGLSALRVATTAVQ